jgi:hypothetical protein
MEHRFWSSKRRQGERRIDIDSAEIMRTHLTNDPRLTYEDRRKSYGRRHDDLGTCNEATCQCGEWNPITKRYEVIS